MNELEAKIAAATALSKIAEIRQLGLIEDYRYLIDIKDVIIINNQAKKETGVDMLNSDIAISLDGFEKYESFLERIIENNLLRPISRSLLGDEIEMIKASSRIDLNSFRGYKIELASSLAKEIAKALSIIPNSITKIAKDSHRVELISGDNDNILSLSRGTIKAKPVLFLFHLSEGPFKNQVSTSRDSFDLKTSASSLDGATMGITVLSCFIVNLTNPLLDEDSLVPVFLQAMSCYCRDLTIGQSTKKFFNYGISSVLMLDQSGKAKLHNYLNSNIYAIYAVKNTKTGYAYSFTYAVDIDLIRSNYKRGVYLS